MTGNESIPAARLAWNQRRHWPNCGRPSCSCERRLFWVAADVHLPGSRTHRAAGVRREPRFPMFAESRRWISYVYRRTSWRAPIFSHCRPPLPATNSQCLQGVAGRRLPAWLSRTRHLPAGRWCTQSEYREDCRPFMWPSTKPSLLPRWPAVPAAAPSRSASSVAPF